MLTDGVVGRSFEGVLDLRRWMASSCLCGKKEASHMNLDSDLNLRKAVNYVNVAK